MVNKITKWLMVIATILIWILLLIGIFYKPNEAKRDYHIQIDTVYNKVRLDSIEYNIVKLDSTIVKLKVKYDVIIEKSYTLDDSSSVELFKQLSMGTD